MDICKCGEGEPFQIDVSCAAQVIAGGLGDGACELGTADATYPFCLQGDGTGNLRVNSEFSAVPCDRVGCYDEGVILLIPGIEA